MAIDLTGGLSAEREYFYAHCPEGNEIRDASNVWIEDADGRFGMRIGVEAVSSSWESPEIYLDIAFADGRIISRRSREAKADVADEQGRPAILGGGPLRFQCIEPFRRWRVTFSGDAPEITAEDLIATPYPVEKVWRDVDFTIDMMMAVPPWIAGALLPGGSEALAGDDAGEFISPRYEQLFRAEGRIRIGDERIDFTGQGLRIRRQGFRKFEGFAGHVWESALFPSGKAFGFNTFPPLKDGEPGYAEGFVFDGDGKLRPVSLVEVPWMSELRVRGDDVACTLDAGEGPVGIAGATYINCRGRYSTKLPPDFPPDFPVIQQSHARYRWGDEEATGMIERSTKPSKMRL
jgi:hypothetical protein